MSYLKRDRENVICHSIWMMRSDVFLSLKESTRSAVPNTRRGPRGGVRIYEHISQSLPVPCVERVSHTWWILALGRGRIGSGRNPNHRYEKGRYSCVLTVHFSGDTAFTPYQKQQKATFSFPVLHVGFHHYNLRGLLFGETIGTGTGLTIEPIWSLMMPALDKACMMDTLSPWRMFASPVPRMSECRAHKEKAEFCVFWAGYLVGLVEVVFMEHSSRGRWTHQRQKTITK